MTPDPTLPFTPITIAGKPYKMCLDFGAVAEAEAELADQIGDSSLLQCSWNLTMRNAMVLFAVSLRVYQPDISFADAKRLVGWDNSAEVCLAIRKAQKQFAPEPDSSEAAADANPQAALEV
jgi:hypothetical protein